MVSFLADREVNMARGKIGEIGGQIVLIQDSINDMTDLGVVRLLYYK